MQNFLQRVFRLQPKEGALVFAFGFLLFGNSLARQVSNIVSVSGVLDTEGANGLLVVLIVDYTLVLIVGALQSLIIDRFNRVRMMAFVSLGFALVFIFLRIMFWVHAPEWLNYSTMYLVAEQQFVLFPLIFWVLANDVFNFSQTKRLFPLIASWSFVGKLAGIAIAGISPLLFGQLKLADEDILLFNAFVYLVSFILVLTTLRGVNLRDFSKQSESLKETLSEGWEFVRDVLSFRYLMVAILALAVADTIIEFRFWVVTETAFPGHLAYQNFYSIYRLVVTLVAFAIQSFVTSRLTNNVQLKNVLLIFPLVAFFASGTMMLLPTVIAVAVGGMFFVKLTRETVDDSSRKSFQALVPEERRGRVSTFMDSYLASVGTIVAAILTGLIVLVGQWSGRDLSLAYVAIAFFASLVAIWAAFRMRSVYEKSLLNWRLKRRQRVNDSMIRKLEDL
jgi:AAA family ATP:ADP antiporter